MNPDTNNTNSATKPSSRAVPAWIIVLTLVLGYFGVVYVDDRGSAFSRTVYGPWKSESDFAKLIPPKDPVFEMGKAVFLASCAICHQNTGLGSAGQQVPPLVESEWVLAEGPNRIIRIVLHGLGGPIKVKDADFGATQMSAFGIPGGLDNKQIAAVLTFIRGNPEWGHKATPVKPDQVDKIRKENADRNSVWTAAELEKIPVTD